VFISKKDITCIFQDVIPTVKTTGIVLYGLVVGKTVFSAKENYTEVTGSGVI
jgi:hypothetical protein